MSEGVFILYAARTKWPIGIYGHIYIWSVLHSRPPGNVPNPLWVSWARPRVIPGSVRARVRLTRCAADQIATSGANFFFDFIVLFFGVVVSCYYSFLIFNW